jgi:hypothetical protein
MPPDFWAKFFWVFLHGVMQNMDYFVKSGETFDLKDVAQFLRGFAALLPCTECQSHFYDLLAEDYRHMVDKWPSEGYFLWSVSARARIAERLGRPVRDAAYCTQKLYKKEFFIMAWNALQLMSFGYPLIPDIKVAIDVEFFFKFLSRVFPNANSKKWQEIMDNTKEINRAKITSPIGHNQVENSSSSSSSISNITKVGTIQTVPIWCQSRYQLVLFVYALRSNTQVQPQLTVLSLDTIKLQWATDLQLYILQWKEKEKAREKSAITN